MEGFIKYGKTPFEIVVVHGGPGAAGSARQLAKDLSKERGIIEALQTEDSIAGQINELKDVIISKADMPVILIGHSWGAWLSVLVAAQNPELVKKIIIIGSGPFEEKYVPRLNETRQSRIKGPLFKKITALNNQLNSAACQNKDQVLAKLGGLISEVDTFCKKRSGKEKNINCSFKIFTKVWKEASSLRNSGQLVKELSKVKCRVLAIHGDYDPHPAMAIKESLGKYVKDFNFVLLDKCGHYPWEEKYAVDVFYKHLKKEL